MTDNSVAGIAIHGDVQHGHRRPDQKPLEDLVPLFQAVLADPGVEEFIWDQYTPYFNDGDPCEFGIHGCYSLNSDAVSLREEVGDFDKWEYETGRYGNANARIPESANALADAIEGGQFENVLLEHFGDHTEVTLKADGFHVEFYDHD